MPCGLGHLGTRRAVVLARLDAPHPADHQERDHDADRDRPQDGVAVLHGDRVATPVNRVKGTFGWTTWGTLLPMEVILGHGASGSAASMRPHVEGLVARGIVARAIDLPRRRAEDAVPAFALAAGDLVGRVIGGHSYGGRVASLLAAERGRAVGEGAAVTERGPAGLVLLSYPLHRPGAPDRGARSAHWTTIRCPVLLLSGAADPFARLDLLQGAVADLLPDAELVVWPRLGHSLAAVLDEVLDRVASFVWGLP